MTDIPPSDLAEVLDRLTRVLAAEDHGNGLNPAQHSALTYLSQANAFSRAPSHVAAYLCTTRGTASQTLKALERKELITRVQSPTDKRSIRYDVATSGHALLTPNDMAQLLDTALSAEDQTALATSLKQFLTNLLNARGHRAFGICNTCKHHRPAAPDQKGMAYCALLQTPLTAEDGTRICHEHTA